MTADTLRALGIAVGSAGTIIAAVAKVFDEREKSRAARNDASGEQSRRSPRKRSLYISIVALCVAILGFVVGFASELASQRKAVEVAAEQSAQTQKTLEGLARVFTRFDTISLQVDATAPLGEVAMADYRHQLESTINTLAEGANAGTIRDGVLVLTVVGGVPDVFSVRFDYRTGPVGRGMRGAIYLQSSAPHVAIFKTPIDPKTFGGPLDNRTPDLQLTPAPGMATMTLVKNRSDERMADYLRAGGLRYERIDMPRNSWSPSGRVMSIKDLEGAQAIIYCPWFVTTYPDRRDCWNATKLHSIYLVINDQRVPISGKDLRATPTEYGTIYTYIFPRLVNF